jgi:hypothetical protein
MKKFLVYYLILVFLSTGCVSENSMVIENSQTGKTVSLDLKKLSDETKLSKEIFVMIGRGGCCNGHIISINRDGKIRYLVGSYSIPSEKWEMPEIYDSQRIKPLSTYKPKDLNLSKEKIKRLEQLIGNEEKLRFKEDVIVTDDYLYSIYLDNKKIAFGYESRMKEFPANLAALVDFIRSEVELYELPGMA